MTRQAARHKEESGGNVSDARSDQKPRQSTRAQKAANGKDGPTAPTTEPQEGYRTVIVKINGVDMPLAIEVKSLPAALGLTSVENVQPVREQPTEKEKRRAPAEPIRRSRQQATWNLTTSLFEISLFLSTDTLQFKIPTKSFVDSITIKIIHRSYFPYIAQNIIK